MTPTVPAGHHAPGVGILPAVEEGREFQVPDLGLRRHTSDPESSWVPERVAPLPAPRDPVKAPLLC